jgi:RNA polymerase sigma-70 factor, ECF subfamily
VNRKIAWVGFLMPRRRKKMGEINMAVERGVIESEIHYDSSVSVNSKDVTLLTSNKSSDEEQTLIERMKAGDHRAFELIFDRYVGRVYRQALRLTGNETDAEDVVQEVFLLAYRKAKAFQGKSEFSTWLYRITVNAALTKLRQRKREKEVSLDDYLPQFKDDGHHLMPVVDWSQDIDKLVAGNEINQIIHQALDQLSPVDRAVVVMSDLEDMSNREVGEALGLTIQAVKARLHRARLFLRGKLSVSLGRSTD